MWILALDVGTSSIRAIGYDALGRPLPGVDARVGCEPSATPDGGSELDPMEAVAYRLAAVYDRLAPVASPGHAVIASGGALGHSHVWTQIMADALAVPLEVLPGIEASSRGAALLALGALGCPAPPPETSGTLVRPDPRRGDIYAAARARQSRLYDSIVGPRVS